MRKAATSANWWRNRGVRTEHIEGRWARRMSLFRERRGILGGECWENGEVEKIEGGEVKGAVCGEKGMGRAEGTLHTCVCSSIVLRSKLLKIVNAHIYSISSMPSCVILRTVHLASHQTLRGHSCFHTQSPSSHKTIISSSREFPILQHNAAVPYHFDNILTFFSRILEIS